MLPWEMIIAFFALSKSFIILLFWEVYTATQADLDGMQPKKYERIMKSFDSF